MSNRVVHFEIQADDAHRAIDFYTKVFGWEFIRWEQNDYWMILTAPRDSKEIGINGGLFPRPCPAPAPEQGNNAFVCTIMVDDYDAYEKKIIDAGGQIAMPKFALAGTAWQGYYIDTEGNSFGLHQPDENAA